jgi:hypothetical protein
MTWYTAPSGAGVFAVGTNLWVAALAESCTSGSSPCVSDATQRITENVLAVAGVGPAGAPHPSRANWMTYYPAGAATKNPGPGE